MLVRSSTAVDAIDYNIVLHCLVVWFTIKDTALSWFQSYPSSWPSIFSTLRHKLSPFSASCGVPQGSVLSIILLTIDYTPLNTLISINVSLNRHLAYADDTLLC